MRQPINKSVSLPILSFLLILSYFLSLDMFAPSLHAMSEYFKVDAAYISIAMPILLFFVAISQFFCGYLSDRYGRKSIILFSSIFFSIGVVWCLLSPNIYFFLIGRSIQGIGVGGLYSQCRVILQDTMSKDDFIKIILYLNSIQLFAPLVAPIMGGYSQDIAGWQGSFYIMLLYGVIAIMMSILFKETIKEKCHEHFNFKKLYNGYVNIFKTKYFIPYLMLTVSGISGLIAYYIIAPFPLIQTYHFTSTSFGVVSGVAISSGILSRLSSIYLQKKYSYHTVIALGVIIMLLSTLLLFVASYLEYINPVVILIILAFYALGAGFSTPTSMGLALSLFQEHIGKSNASFAFFTMMSVFIVGGISSYLSTISSMLMLAMVWLLLIILAILAYLKIY